MEVTKNELDALYNLDEDESWREDSCKIHGRTLNSLERKGFIKKTLYANGYFWEITDAGINIVNSNIIDGRY